VGNIAAAYGTRNIKAIRGVFRNNPVVGAAMTTAILGIIGTPFFNGSISKYFIMSGADTYISLALMVVNLGTIMVFIRFSAVLFGKTDTLPYKIGAGKQIVIIALGTLCLSGGIFGEEFIRLLFGATVSVQADGYLEKTLSFTVSCVIGFFVVRYFVDRSKVFPVIRKLDLGFKPICALMGGFFAVLLVVSG
jgi:multicomponent Na+:H+ antiporter subunit D